MREPDVIFAPRIPGGGLDAAFLPPPSIEYGTLIATYVTYGQKVTLQQAVDAIEAKAVELGATLEGSVQCMADSFVGNRRVMRFGAPGRWASR